MSQAAADQAGAPAGNKLKREGGIVGLLFASTTSIIGSGWLFGAFHAAKIAGPLAIWSWVAGGVIIALIALCFAELAAMFPRSGAVVHMSHASHGDGLGRIWAWMLFLSYVPVPAVEAEAVVTYANNYLPYFIQPHSTGLLTLIGFIVCAALLGVFALLNLLAVGMLLRVNTALTWWKIAVPAVTGVVLLVVGLRHGSVMAADPGGYTVSAVFSALPAAGIIFSFLGFRTAIDLGGESAKPARDIPLAVIGSVVLSAAVYVLLQVAFLYALRPQDVAKGWAQLSFSGQSGPFAGLATSLGLGWLAVLLYVDAYASPGGTGLISVTGGARVLYAAGETGAGPSWLRTLSSTRAPWVAVAIMWGVGMLFLLPFPAWQLMVKYVTSVAVLTYGLGPIVLLILRRNAPDERRDFRLPMAGVLAPFAFVCSDWVIYWTGFKTNSFLFGIIAVGFALYILYRRVTGGRLPDDIGWRNIAWLVPWFGGLWLLSGLGDIGGGLGLLGFWPGVVAVALWSLVVVRIAINTAIDAEDTRRIMARLREG